MLMSSSSTGFLTLRSSQPQQSHLQPSLWVSPWSNTAQTSRLCCLCSVLSRSWCVLMTCFLISVSQVMLEKNSPALALHWTNLLWTNPFYFTGQTHECLGAKTWWHNSLSFSCLHSCAGMLCSLHHSRKKSINTPALQ